MESGDRFSGRVGVEILMGDDGSYFMIHRVRDGVTHSFVVMSREDLWVKLDDILDSRRVIKS